MKTVAVINYKGGVGKTTITANLAAGLAARGKKVLLIDTHAQASLTFSFLQPDYWESNLAENRTIKNWFDGINEGTRPAPLSSLIIQPNIINNYLKQMGSLGCVDLICSHLGLINVDLELAVLLGGASMSQSKKNYIKVHSNLANGLQSISPHAYDIVLIDCPPNFNIVTKNALVASDNILIPAKPDYLSTLGIDYLLRSVNDLVKDYNEYASLDGTPRHLSPNILGVVFTMMQLYANQPIAAQRQYISQTTRLGVPIFQSFFRENKSIFSDAPQYGLPVIMNQYNYSNQTHIDVTHEINYFIDEFIHAARI